MVRMCHSATGGTQQNHMRHTKKASILAIISFLVVIGFTIPATTYAAGGDSFFFPSQPSNQPHEQLVVYAFGPMQTPSYSNSFPSYKGTPAYQQPYNQYSQPSYNPYTPNYASNNFPQMFQPAVQNGYPNFSTFNSKFVNNTYIAPQVMQYGSIPNSYSNYSYPQSNYGYKQPYQYPSYNSYGGYGGSYAPSTGLKDFWGNDMCNWGSDYGNFPCDRDPHQWIQDPYTGSWY